MLLVRHEDESGERKDFCKTECAVWDGRRSGEWGERCRHVQLW